MCHTCDVWGIVGHCPEVTLRTLFNPRGGCQDTDIRPLGPGIWRLMGRCDGTLSHVSLAQRRGM